MKQVKYSYAPRGNQWAVLKWNYTPNGKSGTTILYFQNKDSAKSMAEKLNQGIIQPPLNAI